MDIVTQTESLLRKHAFATQLWTGNAVPTVLFENESLFGFVFVFNHTTELLEKWPAVQATAIEHFSGVFDIAGEKAWNVYSIFLCEDKNTDLKTQLERIEEDFSLTRKIARDGINTHEELTAALYPLLPILSKPSTQNYIFEERLRSSLGTELTVNSVEAFLNKTVKPEEVVQMLLGNA